MELKPIAHVLHGLGCFLASSDRANVVKEAIRWGFDLKQKVNMTTEQHKKLRQDPVGGQKLPVDDVPYSKKKWAIERVYAQFAGFCTQGFRGMLSQALSSPFLSLGLYGTGVFLKSITNEKGQFRPSLPSFNHEFRDQAIDFGRNMTELAFPAYFESKGYRGIAVRLELILGALKHTNKLWNELPEESTSAFRRAAGWA